MPNAEGVVGCCGKLPVAGDFVRGSQGLPELDQLDAWIQDGLHRSQVVLGSDWQARWDALAAQHFLCVTERGGARILGRLQPSRDAAGRRYPFVVAARLPGNPDLRDCYLPLATSDFLDAAAALLQRGFDGHSVLSVIAAVRGLVCVADLARAEEVFVRESLGTTPELLLQDPVQDPSLLLQQLAGFAAAPPRYCLRWRSRSEAADIAFWLGLLAGFQGQAGAVLGPCLWMWPAQGRGELRLALGPLDARVFPGMLFSDLDDDHAYDLGRDHGDPAAAQAARARFGDPLDLPDLAAVLAAAAKQGRR